MVGLHLLGTIQPSSPSSFVLHSFRSDFAMQSRTQASLLNSASQTLLSPEPAKISPHFTTDSRRYAIYFGSKASLEDLESIADVGSAYEFSAPIALHASSSGDSNMTAAQQIVIRYRASHSSDHETRYSSPSIYSEPDSWAAASIDESVKNIKAVYRESRFQALQNTFQEAKNVATKHGKGSNSPVACPRTGCRDVLPSLTALTYHLHIHDIHDRTIVCTRCEDRFEDEYAMESHNCERSRRLFIRKTPFLGTVLSTCTSCVCVLTSGLGAFHRILSLLSFSFW
ncbi:hypothetical protein CPB84DRAFT_1763875 [Gymnopilus junonius]|uniref:Uncharacterized protein n=1 Tax=Gymnopilus junonius TaxID=109634 RepID=A0A9P5NXX5_GYMJU|nr:hypothetical protein CPB84DRAFT_1763875 [Gymnopilus junonius]